MNASKYILTALLAMGLGLHAQTVPLAGSQRAEALTAIAAAQQPKPGKTLNYTFVQTKHSPLLAQDAVSKSLCCTPKTIVNELYFNKNKQA